MPDPQHEQCGYAENACQSSGDHHSESPQTDRRGKILAGQGIGGDPRKSNDDDRNGRDYPRIYRSLPNDQSTDDADRISHRAGQPKTRFL